MRELRIHQTNAANEAIKITADERDQKHGNASHYYQLAIDPAKIGESAYTVTRIEFQRGPIKEVGVNGLTNEALLAVLIDRLEGFQSGPFACEANARALDGLQQAMTAFKNRTAERTQRGVEGTNVV